MFFCAHMIHEEFERRDFHRNVRGYIRVPGDRSRGYFGQATVSVVVTMNLVNIFTSAVPDSAIKTQDNVFDFVGEIRKQFHIWKRAIVFYVILGKYDTKKSILDWTGLDRILYFS